MSGWAGEGGAVRTSDDVRRTASQPRRLCAALRRSLAAQHRGSTEHEATRSALAGCIGAFVGCATPADAGEMLATYAGGDPGVPREEIHFQALVLVAAARFSAARSFEVGRGDERQGNAQHALVWRVAAGRWPAGEQSVFFVICAGRGCG